MLFSDRETLAAIPPGWVEPLRKFEISLRAQGRSERTVETRIRHLRTMARHLERDPETISEADLIEWSGSQQWAPETRNSTHASARLFFRWFSDMYGSEDPATALVSVRRPVPPPRPAPDRAISTAISQSPPRTQLILELAARLGLRAAEIAQLHTRDIEIASDGWASLTGCCCKLQAESRDDPVFIL